MNARERVTRAIEFRYPNRLPLRFAGAPERSDYVGLKLSSPSGWVAPVHPGSGGRPAPGSKRAASVLQSTTSGLDEWGCYWQEHDVTSLGQVKGFPLEDWSALDAYVFPDPEAPGRFDEAKATMAQYPDRYLVGSVGLMGFNRLFFLRGFENLMMDLLAEPQKVGYLADRVFEFMKGIVTGWAKLHVQAVAFGDDLGTEQGTMMSPALFRSFFKPRYADYCAHCHKLGLHAVLHSCGNVWDIIPDLIECGFDVLNLEQPRVFGLDRLGQTFAGKVCFLTNPDSQTIIPVAPPEVVAQETELVVKALTTESGGLIANADCTWNHGYTPQANLDAMARTFEKLSAMPWGAWRKSSVAPSAAPTAGDET